MKMKQSEIYWQEFSLNIENQYPNINKISSVFYQIDNCVMGGLLLPLGENWI